MERRIEQIAQITALVALIAGCLVVVKPFLAAALGAAITCYSTWPIYRLVESRLRGRRTLAALVMTLLLVLVIVLPLAFLALTLSDNVAAGLDWLRTAAAAPPSPPEWVRGLPLVGENVDAYWRDLATSQDHMAEALQRLVPSVREGLLRFGGIVAEGVVQVSLLSFISFFFYRDGAAILDWVRAALQRVIGALTAELLNTVGGTIRGVLYGLVGTAIAQGMLATIGLWIAGVPSAPLLGFLTFLFSMLPVGPPLIWGGAAAWLAYQDRMGWAVFMGLYGFFVISGVDNVIRPVLISRGTSLPFLLGFLGVLGGLVGFGFVGIFIGPTLLAVAYAMARRWVRPPQTPALLESERD